MAITKLQAESLNLADTYAFTGTVTGAGGVNNPAFEVKATSNQTISTGTQTTMTFDSEVFDTDNAFASNQFTVPTGKGGRYFFYFNLGYTNPNSSNFRIIYLIVNGSGVKEFQYNNIAGTALIMQGQATQTLSAGDVVKLDWYQNSGSNLTTNAISGGGCFFGGYKIIE